MTPSSGSPYSFLWAVVLALGLVAGSGCDSVPEAPPSERQSPSVFAFQLHPDSVHGSGLDLDPDQDTAAEVPLRLAAQVTDSDGEIERVLFTVEPASNPRGAVFGELEPVDSLEHGYARVLPLAVPATRDEIYSIRVFAVDDDSLGSNQVMGQFRFVPASGNGTGETATLSSESHTLTFHRD